MAGFRSIYMKLELDLLHESRYLSCQLPVRQWWMYLVEASVRQCTPQLPVAEWNSTRAMRALLTLGADEYPALTATAALSELASPSCHLISLTADTITIHGWQQLYGSLADDVDRRRAADADRQKRHRDASRDCHVTSRVTDRDMSRCHGHRDGDGDVDVQGDRNVKTPVLPPETSVPNRPPMPVQTGQTAETPNGPHGTEGFGHSALFTAQTVPSGTNGHGGNGHNGTHRPPPPDVDTAMMATAPVSYATAADLTPTLEPARSIVDGWIKAEKYGRAAALRQLVNLADHRDPVNLLAHVHEVAEMPDADCRCAVLWHRVHLVGGPPKPPSDAALAWAKAELDKQPGPTVLYTGLAIAPRPQAEPEAPQASVASPADVLKRRRRKAQ